MSEKYYLDIGNAKDDLLKSPYERAIYRFLEMLPGILSWGTLIFVVFMSWVAPVFIAFFIIAFDIYWLLKTVFLSLHMRTSYNAMRRHMKVNWLEKLEKEYDVVARRSVGDDEASPWKTADGGNMAGLLRLRPASRRADPRNDAVSWQEIYHLITIPFYKEPFDVLSATLEAIIECRYPKEKMILVLASEERAGDQARKTAQEIREKYANDFFKFLVTAHPADILGELAGKGSNATFAARVAKEEIIDALGIPYENIIVSNLDSDTRVYPQYFGRLTYCFLTCENPFRSSFQPVPVYNNNAWQANAFSRVVATSGTFWHMMQQERPEKMATFSSHSMSFKALVELNFWNVKNVSEDSRIFWKALLFYDGDYRVESLYYPVSMDANLANNFWQTALNIYRQQRRWGWGAENVPYVIFGFLKNKKIKLGTKILWTFHHLEGFWSWATNALIIFLLGWLPLFLGGPRFNSQVLSYNLPQVTRVIMTLAMIGLVSSAIMSTMLLPPRPQKCPWYKRMSVVLQWIFLPVTIIVFGALPGLDSQARLLLGKYMGFWVTPKSRKVA